MKSNLERLAMRNNMESSNTKLMVDCNTMMEGWIKIRWMNEHLEGQSSSNISMKSVMEQHLAFAACLYRASVLSSFVCHWWYCYSLKFEYETLSSLIFIKSFEFDRKKNFNSLKFYLFIERLNLIFIYYCLSVNNFLLFQFFDFCDAIGNYNVILNRSINSERKCIKSEKKEKYEAQFNFYFFINDILINKFLILAK